MSTIRDVLFGVVMTEIASSYRRLTLEEDKVFLTVDPSAVQLALLQHLTCKSAELVHGPSNLDVALEFRLGWRRRVADIRLFGDACIVVAFWDHTKKGVITFSLRQNTVTGAWFQAGDMLLFPCEEVKVFTDEQFEEYFILTRG